MTGIIRPSSSPPGARHTSPPADGGRRELAGVRRQIGVVEHQLAAEGALHPSLRKLLGRIASLAAVLSLTAPEGSRPQDRAPSTVSSLRNRIAKLDRLLAALVRISPSSRARLTPTLRTLHSLLRSLLRQRATVVPSSADLAGDRGEASSGCGCRPARPAVAPLAIQALARRTPGPRATESGPTAGGGVIPPGHAVIRSVHQAPSGRQASRQTPPAATPRPMEDPPGGPGPAAGGSVAAGAPGGAAVPVTALTVSMLCVLMSRLLSDRRHACRPRLLELRPERPG